MADTSPATVAARVAHMRLCLNNHDADLIATLSAQLAAANARADHAEAQLAVARDAALVEAADRFPDGRQPWPPHAIRKAILALRNKPAPGVTVQEAKGLAGPINVGDKFVWMQGVLSLGLI